MNKQEITGDMNVEIINELVKLRNRLVEEVVVAYQQRSKEFAEQRFSAWQKALNQCLTQYIPRSINNYNQLFSVYEIHQNRHGESDDDYFIRTTGIKVDSFLESLILDIQNNEYDFTPINKEVKQVETTKTSTTEKSNKVFIVHGHDGDVKFRTADFLRKHGFDPIILHLKASGNRTIIEKLEKYTANVGYGIVLYTPDDLGQVKNKASNGELTRRARQNVIFEHGYLMGLIGRENVATIVKGDIELPNDISGIVYIDDSDWEINLIRELQLAGYTIDSKNI
ncbi:TIR domain-containing protein [Shewanella frigidimarina]|uniref:TIR domain-containing protein n=1 Tax=Shewanella frigidimarina TaxID=56812 RepID=UPI003D7B350B